MNDLSGIASVQFIPLAADELLQDDIQHSATIHLL